MNNTPPINNTNPAIPAHVYVPGCYIHLCGACPNCGRLHHMGAHQQCMRCYQAGLPT